MNQIFALKRLEFIFASYPEIYDYLLPQIIKSFKENEEEESFIAKKPEKLLFPPWDYEGLDIDEEFVRVNEDIFYWPELIKENPDLPWLRKYYLDYLIRNNRLHEYDLLTEQIIADNTDAVDWEKLAQSPFISNIEPWNMDFVVKYWRFLRGPYNKKGIFKRRTYYNIWANQNIPWDRSSFELLGKGVSAGINLKIRNTNIPWQIEELKYFKEIGNQTTQGWEHWNYLSQNKKLRWTAGIIKEFRELWCWGSLSGNESVPIDRELLGEFRISWSWNVLSKRLNVPWSLSLLKEFEEEWDWDLLSENVHLPWSESFLKEFQDRWDWEKLSLNKGIDICQSLLITFERNWNWAKLSENDEVQGIEAFINNYEDQINFKGLSKNKKLSFNRTLLLRYKEKWDWSVLSRKVSLPWTYELIEELENEIYWSFLTRNPGLPWSLHLVDKYAERWDWNNFYYSNFHGLPITLNFIQKYIHNIMETDIMSNASCASKLCESANEVFNYFILKNLVPSPKHPPLIPETFYAEKARQYLKIHKPLYPNEWIEVTLLKVLKDEIRSYNSGVRPYHYYKVVFSCTTVERINMAHHLYDIGKYKESIDVLESFTTELEQDDLYNVFIGQKFMVKSSEENRICNSNKAHPVNYYDSLLLPRLT